MSIKIGSEMGALNFANCVANHAHRCPNTRLGDLVKTTMIDGIICAVIQEEVFEAGKVYAVKPEEVFAEVLKGSKPVMK